MWGENMGIDPMLGLNPRVAKVEPIQPDEVFLLVRNVGRLFEQTIENNRVTQERVNRLLSEMSSAAKSFANAASSLERILDSFEDRQTKKGK